MYTLAIDSSARACSCAVFEDGRLLGEGFIDVGLTHSRTLMPLVEGVLAGAALTPSDMDRFAVSVGPGSFTGVRIGVSAVKGMAFALDKPCVGVSTLLAMAHQPLGLYEGMVCPMMDARVKQVYTALFEIKNGRVIRLKEDEALPIDTLRQSLPEGTLLIGDGAHLLYDPEGPLRIMPPHLVAQRAVGVALAAAEMPDISADEIVPIYLRRPQAEREYAEKHGSEGE